MRTLDLNAMGVVEMEVMETKEVNGGGGLGGVISGWLLDKAIGAWKNVCRGLEEWMIDNPDQVMYYRTLHH